MIHARKGEKETALTWFDKAVERAKEKNLEYFDLKQLWREAAALLGRPGPEKPAAVGAAGRPG